MPSKDRQEVRVNGQRLFAHRLIAEKALGKTLPTGVVVHHHTPHQLVVCQDDAYHKLLHLRTRALYASGHASWRKCQFCKQWDDPVNLFLNARHRHSYHRACNAAYIRERLQRLGRKR